MKPLSHCRMTNPDSQTKRATSRPDHVKAPPHWEKSEVPKPASKEDAPDLEPLDPVRYGDWEKNGIAVDF